MTLKNTKTILFASLIATMIIPVYAGNTFAQEQRYTDLFPESNSSPEIQKKIMKSLHATPDPQTHIPTGQDALAQKILTLIELRDSTNDPITKELINSIFDNLETDLLDVGLVLNEKYVENPEEWDGKLEEHMYSQSRYTEPTHTTKSTTSDFQAFFYYKYWCHNGFLVCNSSTVSQYMNHGSTWSTQSTIHNVGWWGFLAPYHQ